MPARSCSAPIFAQLERLDGRVLAVERGGPNQALVAKVRVREGDSRRVLDPEGTEP